jgi:hypothetical protein
MKHQLLNARLCFLPDILLFLLAVNNMKYEIYVPLYRHVKQSYVYIIGVTVTPSQQ